MRATTIRFSDPIYQRLERASKYTGLPINAIVTAACMEWLRQQFPVPIAADATAEPSESATLERLLGGSRRALIPLFSADAREALGRAESEARRSRHDAIGTEHLLLGIVADESGTGGQALRQAGIDARQVQGAIEFIVGRGQRPAGREPGLSPRVVQAIDRAAVEARERESGEVDTGHLLLGICDDDESMALRILESVGSSADDLKAAIEAQLS